MPAPDPVLRLFLPEVTAPALEHLRRAIPGIAITPLGLEIPLADLGAEEILSLFLRHGVTARATRIGSRPRSG